MNAQGLTLPRVGTSRERDVERDGVHDSARERVREAWPAMAAELARTVLALGIPAASVDDVLQDVYVAAWRQAPGGLDDESLRRWLFRVAINRCHLEHRRTTRWRAAVRGVFHRGSDTNHAPDAASHATEAEDRRLVRAAIGRLKPAWRTCLVLRYYAEFDSKQIAAVLDLPDSTVRSHLRLARLRLADELKRAGYEHEA